MARIYISHRTQETKQLEGGNWQWEKCEEEKCLQCGKMHDSLWIIHRVLADTFGHFACFRINGSGQRTSHGCGTETTALTSLDREMVLHRDPGMDHAIRA
jgi:hypothetical protein